MSSNSSLSKKDTSNIKRKNENNDKGKQKSTKKRKIEIEADPPNITDSKKKIHPVIKIGARCECRLKCCEGFSDVDLQKVLQTVKNFEDKEKQDIYLQTMVELLSVKYDNHKKQNICFYKYFIDINGERKPVCKMAFVNIHGIGLKRCRRVTNVIKANETPTGKILKSSSPKKSKKTNKTNPAVKNSKSSILKNNANNAKKTNKKPTVKKSKSSILKNNANNANKTNKKPTVKNSKSSTLKGNAHNSKKANKTIANKKNKSSNSKSNANNTKKVFVIIHPFAESLRRNKGKKQKKLQND